MKTIIVDDEAIMIKSFLRQGADVDGLNVVGQFQYPEDAIAYAQNNPVNLAVLDISLPGMDGIELARRLKAFHPDILIVFITAYEEYIREANRIGADYYIVKPYTREMLVSMMNKMKLLSRGQRKEVYIQMFGRFVVMHRNNPVQLSGKAKEILALIATRQGKEISNEEIYCTLWENRGYSNDLMKVYYNALRRLKDKFGRTESVKSSDFNTTRSDAEYGNCRL